MGSHPVFSVVVHGLGANLYLNRFSCGIPHYGMQRLVAVGLGNRNVVLETPRQWLVQVVHGAEYAVAFQEAIALLSPGEKTGDADVLGYLLALTSGLALAACNTIEGAGKDVSSAGDAVSDAAK